MKKLKYFNFKLQILIKKSSKSKKFRSLTPLEIQFYLLGGVFREVFIIKIAETRLFYRIKLNFFMKKALSDTAPLNHLGSGRKPSPDLWLLPGDFYGTTGEGRVMKNFL